MSLGHDFYMGEALKEARKALEAGEVPVGAVIVFEGKIIARAHNQVELLQDATAHAELIATTQAARFQENWRLAGMTVFATKEPCMMCAGALVHARITRLVFGARDEREGCAGSRLNLVQDNPLRHRIETTGGVREEECAALLKDFFRSLRTHTLNT